MAFDENLAALIRTALARKKEPSFRDLGVPAGATPRKCRGNAGIRMACGGIAQEKRNHGHLP